MDRVLPRLAIGPIDFPGRTVAGTHAKVLSAQMGQHLAEYL